MSTSSRTFGLGALFELTAGVGVALGLVTQLEWIGVALAVLGGLILAAAHHWILAADRKQAAKNIGCCFLGLMMLLLLVTVCLLPGAVSEAGRRTRRTQCASNVRQLALAIHNYHDIYGHLPPAHIADANGKPMHSWRVLILPFMEGQALYNAYNMNEPWNGPNNSKLASQMPFGFRCPSDGHLPPGMTSYFAITGRGRTKEGAKATTFDDIKDGMASTIMLVESSTARVNWLDPRDLTVEDILAGENTPQRPCPCSRHGQIERGMYRSDGRGMNVAMFDAQRQFLPRKIDPATLKALLTIDGGENVDWDAIRFSADDSYIWPGFWVLLGVEVLFLAAAIVRCVRIARR